jgi:hypothetical protein
MALHSYTTSRTPGRGSITVTRSTDDGLTGGATAHFSFDDSLVTSKLLLTELWRDTIHRINADWVGISAPSDLGAGVEQAFADGGKFDDGALFSDQGAGGHVTYLATLANDNAHVITQDTSNAIGAADAVLILSSNITSKIVARAAINAIFRALHRDGVNFTSPADFPVTGSSVE